MGVSPTRRPGGAKGAAPSARTLPLPLVPATSAPRIGELRVAQLAEEGPRAPEAEADPEPTAGGQRGERLVIVQGLRAIGRWRRGDRHSRVSSSS